MLKRAALLLLAVGTAFAGYDPLSITGEWLINAYKAVLSPLQGEDVCNYRPTCSQFTKQAIDKHGFIAGAVIGADRLTRCNPQSWTHLGSHYHGTENGRMKDPVANHVAWSEASEPTTPLSGCSAPPGSSASVVDVHLLNQTAFADFLFAERDYRRAADEYLRVRFTSTEPHARTLAGLMAGESYLLTNQADRARVAFNSISDPAATNHRTFGIARAFFIGGEYAQVRAHLQPVSAPAMAERRRTLIGWSLLREHRFADAAAVFADANPDLTALTELNGSDIGYRSRALGTVLSSALPGSGQVYAGRVGDGIYALLSVAGSGLLTWWFAEHPEHDRTKIKLGLSGALAVLFYTANVYGANVAVRDFNRHRLRNYAAAAEQLLETRNLTPDYVALHTDPELDSLPPDPTDPE